MKKTEDEKCEKTAGTPPCSPQTKDGRSLAKGEGFSGGFWEYVIIAVVIAAAAALVFLYFGRSVVWEVGVATQAVSGECYRAAAECRSAADHGASSGVQAAKKFSRGDGRSEWGGEERKRRDKINDSTVNPVPIPDDGGPSPSDEFKK